LSTALSSFDANCRMIQRARTLTVLLRWWWLPLVWVLFGLMMSLQPWLWGWMAWPDALRFGLFEWLPWVGLAPAVVWLAVRFPVSGRCWPWTILLHLLAGLAVSGLLEASAARAMQAMPPPSAWSEPGDRFRGMPPRPPGEDDNRAGPRGAFGLRNGPGGGPPRPWLMRMRITLPLYALLVALVHVLEAQHAARVRERRAAQIETQLAEAKLAALQLQLQPHFLFNCLNAISSLVHERPDTAEEMICSLAALLRAALDTRDRREISLEEELVLADRYLAIQRVRFGPALTVAWDIDPEAKHALVPPLLLQPLLENAMVHGLGAGGGTLTVAARREGARLVLEVRDRRGEGYGPAAPAQGSGAHIGLENTRARLAALYAAAPVLELHRGAGGSTARVELPFRAGA
jgi:hypothetical protein